ncbi:MAG TPA: hypothetical protein VI456_02290 [Polyangia bacterium]
MKTWNEIQDGGGGSPAALTGPSPVALAAAPRWGLVAQVVAIALTAGAVAALGPRLGIRPPPATLIVVALGALVVHLVPARAFELTALAGTLALGVRNPPYALFHLALVAALFVARRKTFALATVVTVLALWLPKHLFVSHYHHPAVYDWINEPSLVLVLFVTASWWRARRDGRLPRGAEAASPAAWALPYLFPGHALNPMVFSPADVFRRRAFDARDVVTGLLLVASKALAHTVIVHLFGNASYSLLDPARLAVASRAELWEVVAFGYVDLVVTLSGTADVAVLLARLYGWPMASPFRFALLAWNPVELWRRWGIYNRKLLLSLVYFPLGGSRRHRYRNVMLTFLASALLLHSGWFGSKYWAVGVGGWRDQTVYFLAQGLLVCGCLLVREVRPSAAPDDRALRWSWSRAAGTLATQAASALVHVIILAQALPLGARFELIARCLGAR